MRGEHQRKARVAQLDALIRENKLQAARLRKLPASADRYYLEELNRRSLEMFLRLHSTVAAEAKSRAK